MSAALLAAGVSRCLSRQLKLTLSWPPANHFAKGTFHCSTVFHGLNQTNSFLACLAQNFSGDLIDSAYSLRYSARDLMCARFEKAFGGWKTRFSCSIDSMFLAATAWLLSVIARK